MTMEARAESSTGLDEAQFRRLYERIRSSLPWDRSDRRGALNYIGRPQVQAAAREVELGLAVSLAAPIQNNPSADNPEPAGHEMTAPAGGHAPASGLDFAMDRLSMNVHGNADSHLDALCHVIYDDHLYNGVPAETVTTDGASALSVNAARDGIVSRAVLLDIPRLRRASWLNPGDHVTTEELLAAEKEQGVLLGEGDIALVHVGHRRRRRELGPWDASQARAGLHPDAVALLAERRVSVLGSDGNNDTAPSITAGVAFPVHVLAINAAGIQLLDYLDFDEVLPHCEQAGRWSFLCVIAPLRLPNATGSPVNPIAML
jgi:kynurenine formamidase